MTTTTPEQTPDPYPEHTRQTALLFGADIIGRFIEESEYVLAEYRTLYDDRGPQLVATSKTTQQILAEYFGIDLAKIEAEKRAMIAALAQDQGPS